jgi:hypothetical protein
MNVVVAHGVNGHIEFDGSVVTIVREGVLARLSQGRSVKQIPVRQIQAVQCKPAGAILNGFIQFTIPGEMSSRVAFGARTYDSAKDENAVIFTRSQEDAFLELAGAITNAIAHGSTAVNLAALPAPASPSLNEQLTQLTELHRSGALTDAEFTAAKSRLLL